MATAPAVLLDVHPDPDHNRSVVSLCGLPERVEEGLLSAVAEAARLIDLRAHTGVHPRAGVADVVPLVPLTGSLEEVADDARRLARRIWRELQLPVYLYGLALGGPSLADIRAGRARPAFGSSPHPSAGAVSVGARRPLIAYNVTLPGAGQAAAAQIARSIRATSPDGLPGVQALAFQLADGTWQLSMNLIDLTTAPPSLVLEEVRRRAAALGVSAGGDEVVGLCPAALAPPSAAGRVLEAREGAAVARAIGETEVATMLAATATGAVDLAGAAAELARLPEPADLQLRTVREHALDGLEKAARA